MNTYTHYLLEATLTWTVLLAFYRLAYRGNGNWRAQRRYLPTGLDPALEHTALLHEAAHLRHGHFYERLLLIVSCCALWFHSLVWMYARWRGTVHEVEADAAVAREVVVGTCGRQLLHVMLAPRIVPALFSSPLKQRIAMLTRPMPSRSHTYSRISTSPIATAYGCISIPRCPYCEYFNQTGSK